MKDAKRSGLIVTGILLAAAALAGASRTFALESPPVSSPRVTASLISDRNTVVPGERFRVALVQEMAKGWHTYWINPGDSGEPTRIEWSLPEGATVGPIEWPTPHAIPVASLVNYGFEGTTYLVVDVTAPPDARPGGSFALKASATWLVCEKVCVPEEGEFTLEIPVGAQSVVDARNESRIAKARADNPQPANTRARLIPDGEALALEMPGLPSSTSELHFFPQLDTLIDHAAKQPSTPLGSATRIGLARSSAFKLNDRELAGIVTFLEAGTPRALSIAIDVDPSLVKTLPAVTQLPTATATPTTALLDITFWTALLFAFAGGLILNLMPCVLPVLFIKALGFAQAAQSSPREVREHGLLFLSGVILTFAVLAGAIIGLNAVGSSLGWGYQLQSPPVVIALAVIMVLIGLNLLGAFEIGGTLQGVGQRFTATTGRSGSFATGVLAVIVATPCTAPFMGAAMGFALTQPPAAALSVFVALALGFALPVVALAFAPGWLRLLPRPGRWMVVLKQAFAFPMFATAIWLIWVATVQAGTDGVLAALSAILAAGFVVWLLGLLRDSPKSIARFAGGGIALLIGGVAVILVLKLAQPLPPSSESRANFMKWSPERVAELRAQGKPVFVNFTAAWCITCLANERVALARPEVMSAFSSLDVAYLKADWTNRDPVIAKVLAEHGRAGVPLYLFYTASGNGKPEVLPQLLTPQAVIDAAERAAGRNVKTAAKPM